jgi:hypothetical protein
MTAHAEEQSPASVMPVVRAAQAQASVEAVPHTAVLGVSQHLAIATQALHTRTRLLRPQQQLALGSRLAASEFATKLLAATGR